MSAHEGVSCDACGQSNFHSKRFKCLICYDYDLCSKCHEKGKVSSHHTKEHPMQCILTRQDFNLYYQGEKYSPNQPQSLTCPLCGDLGLAFPFLNESSLLNGNTQNMDLFQHLRAKHSHEPQVHEVICPLCATMTNGEPNFATADLTSHIANDHHDSRLSALLGASGETNVQSRPSIFARDHDPSTNSRARGNFRRGFFRTANRRGTSGTSNVPVDESIVIDLSPGLSTNTTGNDPITNLLVQLSAARRLVAASQNIVNANTSSTSSLNNATIEALTRQHHERERLRAAGRFHQYHLHHQRNNHQSTSNPMPLAESDMSDSIFSSILLADQSKVSNDNQDSWVHIITQQQSRSDPQSEISSKTNTPLITNTEPDPSLLQKILDESASVSFSNQQISTSVQSTRAKNDFLQSVILSCLEYSIND